MTDPATPDPAACPWEHAARYIEARYGTAPQPPAVPQPPGMDAPSGPDNLLAGLAHVRALIDRDPAAWQDMRDVTRDQREHVITALAGLCSALVQDVAARQHITPAQLIDRIIAAAIRQAAQ
jgi:hypothetical protein